MSFPLSEFCKIIEEVPMGRSFTTPGPDWSRGRGRVRSSKTGSNLPHVRDSGQCRKRPNRRDREETLRGEGTD